MGCNILKCTCGSKYYLPQRYIVAIMSLTGILVAYGHRVSLNIAITVMANKTLSESTSCPKRNTSVIGGPKNLSGGVIPWTNYEQNLVLGAFYPGYLIGHIPTGILSDKYGGRYVFSIGMAISTVITLVTPVVVANTPYYVTIILRNLMGLGQSVVYVAISSLYARWVPKEERSMLGAFSFAANSLGVIFGNFATGMLINAVSNWPVGFYFWGLLGIIWCSIFMLYIHSDPDKSPNVTTKEKELLHERIHKGKKPKIPWKAFFMDIGIWALIISEIGHDFTIFTLVNNFPKYLSDVLHYDLAENALASSLPYISQWLGGITAGQIVDYLIKKKGYSVLWCRRIVTTIGSVLPATFVLAAGYMGCNGTLVITMFTFNLLFKGPIYAAMKINHLDMSLNFAGIIMALSNGIGALAGYISPEVINLLAPNNTLEEWQLVFWVVWITAFATNLFYFFFSRARRRKWDFPEDEMDVYYAQEEKIKADKQKKKEEKQAKEDAKKAEKDAKKGQKEAKPGTSA